MLGAGWRRSSPGLPTPEVSLELALGETDLLAGADRSDRVRAGALDLAGHGGLLLHGHDGAEVLHGRADPPI